MYVRPPPEWQPDALGSTKGPVIWKLQKNLYGLRSARRRWQEHLEDILAKSGFIPKPLNPYLWTHEAKRVALAIHDGDQLLTGTYRFIKEVLAELGKDLR